ncbi:chromate resistance protein ChrB domain-containing protein [Arvimicrobium flavum]|uniref:chromate resistance protein ChrB domain-containing protein n=1 Tax=Arvimicrobium flavum TaxID=3393320 RepID=UPI00237A62C5|nr:chromate resistance protein ChrB domain-containing protein [Mesorhizobium shangrilense]
MPRHISPHELIARVGLGKYPLLIDVRRPDALASSPVRLPAAIWRSHMQVSEWLPGLPPGKPIIVYCTHGHNVSEIAAAGIAARGANVTILEGGLEGWIGAGGPVVGRSAPGLEDGLPSPSVWVTRERPKIDRIACPWLLRRFVDPFAIVHFVAPQWVADIAGETGWIPFDVENVHYSHRGDQCTFDTMIAEFGISDPALLHLARIVRGADTARPELEPQAAGLLAVSLGLSAIEPDDRVQLEAHNWPARTA